MSGAFVAYILVHQHNNIPKHNIYNRELLLLQIGQPTREELLLGKLNYTLKEMREDVIMMMMMMTVVTTPVN